MYGYNNNPLNLNQINSEMQRLENLRNTYQQQVAQQPTNLTQNFQFTPQGGGIHYVESTDDVKKELVFADTIFTNKDLSHMWFKSSTGEIKEFETTEIIQMDEKDRQIAYLMAKIDKLEKEINSDAKPIDKYASRSTSNKESKDVSDNKSSKK